MKLTLSSLFFLIVGALSAQDAVQDEIDQQIWIPFTVTWEQNDSEGFNALHASDIVRVGGQLTLGDQYKERNTVAMQQIKQSGSKMKIEFAFDQRLVSGTTAYETGFYRITSYTEPRQPYVARFHVLLKKVDGIWKIAVDYDADTIGQSPLAVDMYKDLTFFHFEK